MRKSSQLLVIITLTIIVSCYSCSKEKKDSTIPPPSISKKGAIEYKLNGTLMRRDNDSSANSVVYCNRYSQLGPIDPYFDFVSEAGNLNSLHFQVVVDNLTPATYHEDAASIKNYFSYYSFGDQNGQTYRMTFDGDYLDVKISSYKDYKISGTFSGKFTSGTDYANRSNFVITDGKLENVPVTQ